MSYPTTAQQREKLAMKMGARQFGAPIYSVVNFVGKRSTETRFSLVVISSTVSQFTERRRCEAIRHRRNESRICRNAVGPSGLVAHHNNRVDPLLGLSGPCGFACSVFRCSQALSQGVDEQSSSRMNARIMSKAVLRARNRHCAKADQHKGRNENHSSPKGDLKRGEILRALVDSEPVIEEFAPDKSWDEWAESLFMTNANSPLRSRIFSTKCEPFEGDPGMRHTQHMQQIEQHYLSFVPPGFHVVLRPT